MADERTREELARDLESLRRERAIELARNVDQVAASASREREALASKVAYDAGAEAARIDTRLDHLDSAVGRINGSVADTATALNKLREDMNGRFNSQNETAETTKRDNRKLLLQIFGTVIVATIGAAGGIVVALITSGPA